MTPAAPILGELISAVTFWIHPPLQISGGNWPAEGMMGQGKIADLQFA